ncbi:type II secretion system F family protein [Oceanisphaera arctica]|uniref:Pilus assembly protein TadB n=1 Tax=Oceanisphaera arctica TaxID=641510 RepID=A0A2P5TJC7_9GAMM|nr:type II secretion system F family protein [Oceanisphaera arctica]PPL15063.1 pilus assembly protein TadB [Oceanisphaera arctica]GHA17697.1 pilus assembly protein TadB [Oceanisphaera arctica]
MSSNTLIFLALVGLAVVFLSLAMFVPVTQPRLNRSALLKRRIAAMEAENREQQQVSIYRTKRLDALSPLLRRLETSPLLERVAFALELAGSRLYAYQLVFLTALVSLMLAVLSWWLWHSWLLVLLALVLPSVVVHIKLKRNYYQRLGLYEQQLPEALDIMKRGLQAGYSFADTIKLISEQMPDPLGREFALVFADINYRKDIRKAMTGLLERVPSVSNMALISAVQVQRETGGNLVENIDKLAKIIRDRFKFNRQLRTLSAEGRMSGWVLVLTPFALFAMMFFTSPDYIAELVSNKDGHRLLIYGGIAMTLGVWWISRIIKIEV